MARLLRVLTVFCARLVCAPPAAPAGAAAVPDLALCAELQRRIGRLGSVQLVRPSFGAVSTGRMLYRGVEQGSPDTPQPCVRPDG